jgi:hypothetical protein
MSAGLLGLTATIALLVLDVSKEVEIQLERKQFICDKLIRGVGDYREASDSSVIMWSASLMMTLCNVLLDLTVVMNLPLSHNKSLLRMMIIIIIIQPYK